MIEIIYIGHESITIEEAVKLDETKDCRRK